MDSKKIEKKSKSKDSKEKEFCYFMVDPCGCYMVDPCGCYVANPCCC